MESPFESPQTTGGARPQPSVPVGSSIPEKDVVIAREVVAKTFLELGTKIFTPEVEAEMDKWVKWILKQQ